MKPLSRIFSPRQTARHHITWNDVVVLTATAAALIGWRWYPAVRLDEVRAEADGDEGRHG